MTPMSPLVVPKASDILANRLRDMVFDGRLSAGDMLPTERELVAQTNLSRTAVREALRILEVEGLISTRPGRSGGSTVTLPGRLSISRSVERFVKTHGMRLDALLECRVGVEPYLASLAAAHRSEADLETIRSLHAEFVTSVDDIPRYKRINLDWHLAVARASGNELLIALMEAVAQPILEAAGYQQVTTDSVRAAAIRAHGRILEAIETRNTRAAFNRMERHVTAYSELAHRMMSESEEWIVEDSDPQPIKLSAMR